MPETNHPIAFLEVFTRYLRLRLEKLPKPDPLPHERGFKALLRSLGGNPRSEAFRQLVRNMERMKTGSDPKNPRPKPPRRGGRS